VVDNEPKVITVRRTTVVRAGVVLLVLAALGIGTAIGLSVGSGSPPPHNSSSTGTSSTTAHTSTTTSVTHSTTVDSIPSVLSCGPKSTPHVRPTTLTVGCTTKLTTVTGITWNVWEASAGGQGTGTVKMGFLSAPAIVVVFHEVAGIFQDVTVTPLSDATSTPLPTTTTTQLTTPSIILPTTTTTTTTIGGIAPVAASQPGTGWGGS
jgi:hypothetical protein